MQKWETETMRSQRMIGINNPTRVRLKQPRSEATLFLVRVQVWLGKVLFFRDLILNLVLHWDYKSLTCHFSRSESKGDAGPMIAIIKFKIKIITEVNTKRATNYIIYNQTKICRVKFIKNNCTKRMSNCFLSLYYLTNILSSPPK